VILDDNIPQLGATAVAASCIVRFDETFPVIEDVEWWLRMAARSTVSTETGVGCERRRHSGARVNGTDMASRVEQSCRLMREHRAYFDSHPRAAAFRWSRTGALALEAGEPRRAIGFYLRSLRVRPSVRGWRGLALACRRVMTPRPASPGSDRAGSDLGRGSERDGHRLVSADEVGGA
jgi:hypothetical protein